MTSTAVSVSRLTKQFGDRTAVASLDLELPTGVVAGFVGPNGAGKSTTMAMLLGLIRPTSGSGTVLGHDIAHPGRYLGRVGALIEGPAFYPSLTGFENLSVFATVGGNHPAEIPGLLDRVGLSERGDDPYSSYSLGMKQRLGIAAALLGDPELLILDEPANGLDPEGVREIRELVGRLAESGRTVLVSSHDLSELEQICDWLLLLDTGRSLYQGPARDLLDGAVTGLFVAASDKHDPDALLDVLNRAGHRFERCEGGRRLHTDLERSTLLDIDHLAASINETAFTAGLVLCELTRQTISLEDRYLDMVHDRNGEQR